MTAHAHLLPFPHRATMTDMVARIATMVMVASLIVAPDRPTNAQELPPISATLLNRSGVVCISISKQGNVSGAYVLEGMGDAQADKDMLAWIRQLHWPAATPDEKMRDTWFPMPIAFGDAKPIAAPPSCSAPS